jgi:hypothetical protein
MPMNLMRRIMRGSCGDSMNIPARGRMSRGADAGGARSRRRLL